MVPCEDRASECRLEGKWGEKDGKRRVEREGTAAASPQHHQRPGSPASSLHHSSSVLAPVSIQSESPPNGKGNISVPPALPALLEK